MRLMKLEMKRILKTRLTLILLLFALLLSFSMALIPTTFPYADYPGENGELVELLNMKAYRYKKAVQAAICGPVTAEKVRKALESYQEVLKKYGVEQTYDLPRGVYYTEIFPYAPLLNGIREVYADPQTGIARSLMDIEPEELDDYYDDIDKWIISLMRLERPEHPAAQRHAEKMLSKVTKPYVFSQEYPSDAVDYQVLLGFLVLCICAVIAAPVFTSDYQTGADDILRCTRYGKASFALVKIGAALLICGGTMLLCSVIYVLVSDSLFGWETTKTSIQMIFSIVNLPDMNVGEMQLYILLTGILSLLATLSLVLFLSSRCRNVIVSLSAALGICLLPLIVYMVLPSGLREWVYSFIPSSGVGIQTSFLYALIDFVYLSLGDISLWHPHAMITVCLVEIPLFIALAVKSYTGHKIR